MSTPETGNRKPETEVAVEIKVRANGPYRVTGPVRIVDADGNEIPVPDAGGKPIVLCRCGQSQTKPFCDQSHKACGFEAPSPPRPSSAPPSPSA